MERHLLALGLVTLSYGIVLKTCFIRNVCKQSCLKRDCTEFFPFFCMITTIETSAKDR